MNSGNDELPKELKERENKIRQLMDELLSTGQLHGKEGWFVIYTNDCKLIKIVPSREELVKAIGEVKDLGGYLKVKSEDARLN